MNLNDSKFQVDIQNTKLCPKCKEYKVLNQFYSNKKNCFECEANYQKNYRSQSAIKKQNMNRIQQTINRLKNEKI